jgi:hypothetical protein
MKQHPIAVYLTKLSIFSIVICFMFLFFMLFFKGTLSPHLPYYIVMFWTLTAVGYCLVYFLPQKNIMNFENIFMLAKFGKMLIYIAVLTFVYMFEIENGKSFTISYLILFMLYLIFDTITLNVLAKKKNNKSK